MKILFICSSLEPGKDGVGDYTRLLSAELIRQGNPTAIIALNDKFVKKEEVYIAAQTHSDISIPVMRISSQIGWRKKTSLANEFIASHTPDFLSLQYVPYGFHPKGLPVGLAWHLSSIGQGRKWHIMFHEPYLGTTKNKKELIIQWIQKMALRLLVIRLQPKFVHTSIKIYQHLLSRVSIESKILGLFGNIAISLPNSLKHVPSMPNHFKAVYFGQAPKIENHKLIANLVQSFLAQTKCHLTLFVCGRTNQLINCFIETLSDICDDDAITISILGELQENEISEVFGDSDFGIARVVPEFIGKSGSTISMLEHGLPVWVPLAGNEVIADSLDFRSHLCFSFLERSYNILKRETPKSRAPTIAKQLIVDLAKSAFVGEANL